MGRPKHTKPDENQSQFMADLERIGAVVWRLSDVGGEVLDLMVFFRGEAVPTEVKQAGLEDNLTGKEQESLRKLLEIGVQGIVASSIEMWLEKFEALHGPRWRVVDEAALRQVHEIFADVLTRAVKLVKLSLPPHKKKKVYELRDAILELEGAWLEAIQYR